MTCKPNDVQTACLRSQSQQRSPLISRPRKNIMHGECCTGVQNTGSLYLRRRLRSVSKRCVDGGQVFQLPVAGKGGGTSVANELAWRHKFSVCWCCGAPILFDLILETSYVFDSLTTSCKHVVNVCAMQTRAIEMQTQYVGMASGRCRSCAPSTCLLGQASRDDAALAAEWPAARVRLRLPAELLRRGSACCCLVRTLSALFAWKMHC